MNPPIARLIDKLDSIDIDGLILSNSFNMSYLTGHRCRDSYLLVSRKKNIYITDSRYTLEAQKFLKGFEVKEINGSFFKVIASACQSLSLKKVGFEERYLPFAEYVGIKKKLSHFLKLVPTHSLIEELRQLKTEPEIKRVRQATDIASSALKHIKTWLRPGQREIEIAGELEKFLRYNGADGAAFDIIVASGANSSFPHHISSQKRIHKDEPVLIDIGADFKGYKSDLTRVFFMGKITPLFKKIYDIVLQANKLAISKIKPAISIKEIDNSARNFITNSGYGGFFSHSLGHGIGLEVHEDPHISLKSQDFFQKGMLFTIEPAIYLPGKFGVRIEDLVLVKSNGAEVLSGTLNK